MERHHLQLPDLRLSYLDYGGEGPGVLLLHGLMSCATTWHQTAPWLSKHFRVVALDQRGHGLSDKPDHAYTRQHYVTDAAEVIERLKLGPAIVIGHSMGALNGWVLAAKRPDLVRGLVLEDSGADTASRESEQAFARWFAQWPLPFKSAEEVRSYFDALVPTWGEHFLESMVEGPDGWRPVFRFEHMLQSCADWDAQSYWQELEAVQCPSLIIKGGESALSRHELQEMARRMRHGRYMEVANANHVVHHERPAAWRAAVEPFMEELRSNAQGQPDARGMVDES